MKNLSGASKQILGVLLVVVLFSVWMWAGFACSNSALEENPTMCFDHESDCQAYVGSR